MAIQKQSLNINFSQGMDQKTDPLQVKPGRFLSLINRVFNKGGRLEKRFGFTALAKTVANVPSSGSFNLVPATVAAGRSLAKYNSELVLNDGLQLYSYAPTPDNWVYKGRKELCSSTQSSVYKDAQNNVGADSAINSTLGLKAFAWESLTRLSYKSILGSIQNGVYVTAIDSTTNQVAFTSLLSSTASRPKCVSISNKLYVFYFDTSDNKIHSVAVTQSGLGTPAVLISDNDATAPNYDVLVNNSLIYVAYNGTANTVKIASFSSALVASATASKAETATNGVSIFADASNNVWVAYNNAAATKAFIMNSTLVTTVLAATVVDNAASAVGVQNVTGIHDGTRGIIFYDIPGAPIVGQALVRPGTGTNFTVTAAFTQPAVGALVSVTIDTASPLFTETDAIIYIPSGGYYYCQSESGAVLALYNLGYTGNAAPGATVASTRKLIYHVDGYQNAIITYNTLTAAGAVGTAATFLRSACLASKAFMVNGAAHVTAAFDSPLQASYFVCGLFNTTTTRPAAFVSAKLAEDEGGGVPFRSILPSVNTVSSGVFQCALLQRSFLILQTAGNQENSYWFLGVSSFQIDFVTNEVLSNELGNNLQIGSGSIGMYDGANCVEHGFHIYPETVSVSAQQNTSSSNFTAGTYGYKIIYEWIDSQGQKHRSAPSLNVSFTIASAPAAFTGDTTNGSAVIINCSTVAGLQVGMRLAITVAIPIGATILSIDSATQITIAVNATATAAGTALTPSIIGGMTIAIPNLRITEKQTPGAFISIYRTIVNGTTYFKITNPNVVPTPSSFSSDTTTFASDQFPDSSITGNEQLYTGEEVENIEAPGSNVMTEFKNRLIVVPSGNPYEWRYSKQVINGSPVEFSDLFQQNMNTIGGGLTGLAKIDDKLILFKSGQVFYVTGTGPSPSGANNDFTDPQFITSDAGCVDPRSIVTTPVGIMFKSQKGIYLLDRSLQARYIGADVEDYNSYTVNGAHLIANSNQVRFSLSSGVALVYDYYWTDERGIGQWGVFNNISAVSTVMFDDRYSFVTSAGQVYKENQSSYLDGATSVNTSFKTSWISLAGLQGFERAYYFYFLAQYISAHTLTINIYYDYDATTVAQTLTITPNSSDLEQWRVFFNKMKCEAFMIEVQENGSSGAGFYMSGLDLVVGIKKGYVPVKAAASAS